MLVAKLRLRQRKFKSSELKREPRAFSRVMPPCSVSLVDWICHSLASCGCVLLPGPLTFLWTSKSVELTVGLQKDQFNIRSDQHRLNYD